MEIPKIDMKNIDKKYIKFGLISIGIIIAIIVILVLVRVFITSKLSYSELESKMRDVAISYYKNHEDLLPKTEDTEVTLTSEKMVNDELMKPFEKYIKNDSVTCSGKVIVTNNNGNYLYTPYLDCGKEYKTTTLVETLIDNKNIVDNGDGLYNMGNYYLYRGENVNNYIEFAGEKWRILKINNDGTIKIIQNGITTIDKDKTFLYDDRYNQEKNSNVGFNNFNVSRIKDVLNKIYDSNKFNDLEKSYIVSKNLCIGARNNTETNTSGSVECSTVTDSKYPLGLIQVNEYMQASLDSNCTDSTKKECSNYNFLASTSNDFWTITPYNSKYSNTYEVYVIYKSLYYDTASRNKELKLVTNLSSHSLYSSGDGSEEHPYVIKYLSTKK